MGAGRARSASSLPQTLTRVVLVWTSISKRRQFPVASGNAQWSCEFCYTQKFGAVPKWPKGEVCKTSIRGFKSHPRLQPFHALTFARHPQSPIINGQTKFAKAHAGILFAIKMVIVGVALAVPQRFAYPQSTSRQKEPVRRADITSGKKIFANYCASCNGIDGRGSGPAAAALKPAPRDLTTLAKLLRTRTRQILIAYNISGFAAVARIFTPWNTKANEV